MATKYSVPGAEKAIELIELLSVSDQALGVSELVQRLDSNPNMIFRLLHSLMRKGWILAEQPGPRYRMSLRPFHYCSQVVARMDLRIAASGPLRELWQGSGECCYLGVLDEDRVLYIEAFNPTKGAVRVSVELGGRYELHTSAPGKVLLAHDEQALARQLARGLPRRTERTIVDADDLRGELLAAREQGYAVDQGEGADGLLCLAVPIFDHQVACVGTMGVSVLSMNHSLRSLKRELLPALVQAGQQASAHLGHSLLPG